MNPDPSSNQSSGSRLPSKHTLEYLKIALELLLLLLAVPYLLKQLIGDPAKLSRQAASKHLKGG